MWTIPVMTSKQHQNFQIVSTIEDIVFRNFILKFKNNICKDDEKLTKRYGCVLCITFLGNNVLLECSRNIPKESQAM